MAKIFVLGSYFAALTIRVPRLPVLGEALIGDGFDLGPGGKGTNQAIGVSRLGARARLLACVGDDVFGDMALQVYEEEGLATTRIHRVPGVNTGVGCVSLLPTGDNTIVAYAGANIHLSTARVEAAEELIADSDMLISQLEAPLDSVQRALELAGKHSVPTLLNPAPGQLLAPDITRHVDVMTPNENETRILLGLPPDDPGSTQELAPGLMELGVAQVVVTQGREGALIVRGDEVEAIPPVAVEAVDMTGAGDAFTAALAVALCEGSSLRRAVGRATFAGAYAATRLGVIAGLPTRAELDAFIQRSGSRE